MAINFSREGFIIWVTAIFGSFIIIVDKNQILNIAQFSV